MQFFRQNLLAWDKNTDFTILFDYSKATQNIWAIDHFQAEVDQVMRDYTVKVPQLPQLTQKEKDMSYLIHNHIKNNTNIFIVEQVKRKTLKKTLTKKSSVMSKEGYHQCACCEVKYRLKHRCAHTLCKKPCLRMLKNQKMRRRKYKDKSYLFSHVDERFDDDGQYKASEDFNSQFDDSEQISTPPIRVRTGQKGKKVDTQWSMDHKTQNKQPQIDREMQKKSNSNPQEPLKINDIFLNEAKQFQPKETIEKNAQPHLQKQENQEDDKHQSVKRNQNTIKIKKDNKEPVKRPGKRARGKGAKQPEPVPEVPKSPSQAKDEAIIKNQEVQKNENDGIEGKKSPSKKKGRRRPGSQKSMSKNSPSKKTRSRGTGKIHANKDEESQQFEESLRKKMNLSDYCSLQMIQQDMIFDFKVDEEAIQPAKKEKVIKQQKPVSKTRGQIQRKIKEIGKSKLINSNQEDEEISVNLEKYLIDNEDNKKQDIQDEEDRNEGSQNSLQSEKRGQKPESPQSSQKAKEMSCIQNQINQSKENLKKEEGPKSQSPQFQNETCKNGDKMDVEIPNQSKEPIQSHQAQELCLPTVKQDDCSLNGKINEIENPPREPLKDNLENVDMIKKEGVQAVEAEALEEQKPQESIEKKKQQGGMDPN